MVEHVIAQCRITLDLHDDCRPKTRKSPLSRLDFLKGPLCPEMLPRAMCESVGLM